MLFWIESASTYGNEPPNYTNNLYYITSTVKPHPLRTHPETGCRGSPSAWCEERSECRWSRRRSWFHFWWFAAPEKLEGKTQRRKPHFVKKSPTGTLFYIFLTANKSHEKTKTNSVSPCTLLCFYNVCVFNLKGLLQDGTVDKSLCPALSGPLSAFVYFFHFHLSLTSHSPGMNF